MDVGKRALQEAFWGCRLPSGLGRVRFRLAPTEVCATGAPSNDKGGRVA